jgi:hypothetical protein
LSIPIQGAIEHEYNETGFIYFLQTGFRIESKRISSGSRFLFQSGGQITGVDVKIRAENRVKITFSGVSWVSRNAAQVSTAILQAGNGVTIDPATDGGKGQGSDPVGTGQVQAVGVTAGQQAAVFLPVPVNRPHGVDHPAGRQSVAPG